jgi:hypothetical protein
LLGAPFHRMKHVVRDRANGLHLDNIVHADDMRSAEHARSHRARSGKQRLALAGMRQERLARRTHKNGKIELGHFAQSRQNLRILLPPLPEANTGIDHDAQHVHARAPGAIHGSVQIFHNGAHHILEWPERRPRLRLPAHVVEDHPGVVFHHRLHQ